VEEGAIYTAFNGFSLPNKMFICRSAMIFGGGRLLRYIRRGGRGGAGLACTGKGIRLSGTVYTLSSQVLTKNCTVGNANFAG